MIFVDTSAWLALANQRDAHHEDARAFMRRIEAGRYGAVVTTDYVLDETYTLVSRRLGTPALKQLVEALADRGHVHVARIDAATFDAAVARMLAADDKQWSLTDCTSFETMRALDIKHAFAFDRHFAQAGFQRVP